MEGGREGGEDSVEWQRVICGRTTAHQWPAKFSTESLVIFVEKSNNTIDFPGEWILKIIAKIDFSSDEDNCYIFFYLCIWKNFVRFVERSFATKMIANQTNFEMESSDIIIYKLNYTVKHLHFKSFKNKKIYVQKIPTILSKMKLKKTSFYILRIFTKKSSLSFEPCKNRPF